MFNHSNKIMKEATPGTPVDIMGWDNSPTAGDQFISVKSQKEAKAVAEKNKDLLKNFEETTYSVESRVDDMMKLLQEGELSSINIIIKADTNGSVEALKDGLLKLSTEEIDIQVVHSGVGGIVLSDVDLASATQSIIVGFNVRPDSQARNMAQSKGIDIRTYKIIYELLDDINEAVNRLRAVGIEPVSDPVIVPTSVITHEVGQKILCYFHDPDGILLELTEYRHGRVPE